MIKEIVLTIKNIIGFYFPTYMQCPVSNLSTHAHIDILKVTIGKTAYLC